MLYKLILLSCIVIVTLAEAPKPDNAKTCRAIGGRCTKAAACPLQLQDVLRNVCNGDRVCCSTRQILQKVEKKRTPKGCRQKHRCRRIGGRCIPTSQACPGKVKEGACKKGSCQCCILKDGDQTQTKNRSERKRNTPSKRKKKDGVCAKKKRCKGFCVAENEECLGNRDPRGCRGKKCSCCTLGDQV